METKQIYYAVVSNDTGEIHSCRFSKSWTERPMIYLDGTTAKRAMSGKGIEGHTVKELIVQVCID